MSWNEIILNEISLILNFFIKYETNKPITLYIYIDVNNKRELNKLKPYIKNHEQKYFIQLKVTDINENFLSLLCKLNNKYNDKIAIFFGTSSGRYSLYNNFEFVYDEINNSQ